MKEEMREPMLEALNLMGAWEVVPPEELPYFHREHACSRQARELGLEMVWFYDDEEDEFDDRLYQLTDRSSEVWKVVRVSGSSFLTLDQLERWLRRRRA